MKKVDEQRHFLALLKRPGDYVFIAISKLDIANGIPRIFLQAIDSFTMNFTIDEIIQSIKRANIVSEEYLNGQLVIQDNQKHNPLKVIDKDFYSDFNINVYLKELLNNKNRLNNIINKFSAIVKDERISKDFKDYLKSGNIEIVINIIFSLPYLEQRKIIVYFVEENNMEREKSKELELIRDKAA